MAALLAALSCSVVLAEQRDTCNDDSIILVPNALSSDDTGQILAAEIEARSDPFLEEHDLINRTRRITGSRATQSVTWLHRHRIAASGVIERAERIALAAPDEAGWGLQAHVGPLGTRCIESIRYLLDDDHHPQPSARRASSTIDSTADLDLEGWHQDEWSVLTAVTLLSTTADLEGGEIEVDRGAGTRTASAVAVGDMLIFRSWDAHRSTPLLRGGAFIEHTPLPACCGARHPQLQSTAMTSMCGWQ